MRHDSVTRSARALGASAWPRPALAGSHSKERKEEDVVAAAQTRAASRAVPQDPPPERLARDGRGAGTPGRACAWWELGSGWA